MKKERKITIKLRLILSGVGIFIILATIAVITKFYVDKTFRTYQLLSTIKDINSYELMMRKNEKDFFLKESINDRFYESGRSVIEQDFNALKTQTISLINNLKAHPEIIQSNLTDSLINLENDLIAYGHHFNDLVSYVKQKGYKDYGLVGEMRSKIHDVESIVKDNNDLRASNHMLMLRRHEKDYLLRKDTKYKEKFDNTFDEFDAYLEKNTRTDIYTGMMLKKALEAYKSTFEKVIKMDQEIGLTDDAGVLANLNVSSTSIERQVADLHQFILEKNRSFASQSIFMLFGIMALLSIGILLILRRISKEIIQSLESIGVHIGKLGKGMLPEKMDIPYRNEIADMMEQINILTDNLKNTRSFALEVGQGNLNTEINVFDNQGDLGGSLIEMRNRLRNVAVEREKKIEEDRIRIWINEGLNKILEVLRHQDEGMEAMAFRLIQTLVKYMKANQAGLFLIDSDDDAKKEDIFYKLIATYAYDRKKFMEKRIRLGEGMVGTCAIEGEYIYLTDIPKEYITITSGLGDAVPNSLVLMPLKTEDKVVGVIELASFNKFDKYELSFLEQVCKTIAQSIEFKRNSERTSLLLEQSKMQEEELRANEEEMRQNMEELKATQEELSRKEHSLKKEIDKLKSEKETNVQVLLKELKRIKRIKKEYNAILNTVNSSLIIGELSIEGEFLKANQNFCSAYEINCLDLEDKNIFDFIHESEHDEFRAVWQRIAQGEMIERIGKRTTERGKEFWLKSTYSPIFDDHGKVEKILYLAKNISQPENIEAGTEKSDIMETRKILESNLQYFIELQNKWPKGKQQMSLS